jgi:chromosome segregation ATPase
VGAAGRWVLHGISGVRDLLATISAAPMNTTFEDLYNLALLCLCQSHASQADMVASEWMEALRNTTRQYPLSSGPSRNSMVTNTDVRRLQQTIASLERDLANKRAAADAMTIKSKDKEARLLEETLSWKKNYESLNHETKLAQQTSVNKINSLEAKISSLENSFQRDQREISAQIHSLSELRTAKKKLEADVQQSANQLKALKAEHLGANDEVQLLKEKLQQSTTQNGTLQTERIIINDKIESLQGDFRNLQTKMCDLEKRNESMAIELAAKNLALRGEETRVKELMKVISNLEISEAHLKQVIASCWLHRIYNWFTGSRLVF